MVWCVPWCGISKKIQELEHEMRQLQQQNAVLDTQIKLNEQSIQLCRQYISQCDARLTLLHDQMIQKHNASDAHNIGDVIESIVPQTKTLSIIGSYLLRWRR